MFETKGKNVVLSNSRKKNQSDLPSLHHDGARERDKVRRPLTTVRPSAGSVITEAGLSVCLDSGGGEYRDGHCF